MCKIFVWVLWSMVQIKIIFQFKKKLNTLKTDVFPLIIIFYMNIPILNFIMYAYVSLDKKICIRKYFPIFCTGLDLRYKFWKKIILKNFYITILLCWLFKKEPLYMCIIVVWVLLSTVQIKIIFQFKKKLITLKTDVL